jgi:hypothetical protein
VPVVMPMMVTMVPPVMVRMMLAMAVMMATAPRAFRKREVIAHSYVVFAHSLSLDIPEIGAASAVEENIINISSYFKYSHQIIIIRV